MDFTELMKAFDAPIGIILLFMLAGIRRDVKGQHRRLNRIERRLFPEEDDSTPPHGPGRTIAAGFLLFAGLLMLPGCDLSTTRSTTSTAGIVSGTIDGRAVELHYTGDSEGKAVQTVDASAIAAAAGKAAGDAALAAVKAAVPGLDQVVAAVKAGMPSPADDTTAKVVAGAGAAGTLLAGLIAAMKARDASRHREDADEAWDRLAPPATKG